MKRSKISLNGDDWKLSGWHKNEWRFLTSMELGIHTTPVIPNIPATVPGAVQCDLMLQGLLCDPFYGLDSIKGEWVNNREWIYEKEFFISSELNEEKVFLCFDGLDYNGQIVFNGNILCEFTGMFVPVEIDITGVMKRGEMNKLQVVFYISPEVDGQFGYSSRIRHLKSRFNTVWDWCPRIIPIGIWEDVYLKITSKAKIIDFFPKTSISADGIVGNVDVILEVEAFQSGTYQIEYKICKDNNERVFESYSETLFPSQAILKHSFHIDKVDYWWPNGWGNQELYHISVTIKDKEGNICDYCEKNVGFRKVKLVDNFEAPLNSLAYTFMINEKRVFIKGVNWVPISPFYGSVAKEQYRNTLQRFRDMNCNLLRVWGGAILEKQAFYDLCDEMGLMVWQEFPQSSSGLDNTPPDDPEFLLDLKQVATVYIKRKRHHACHVLWCGGNELMSGKVVPISNNHINIQMLERLVIEMDSEKPFLPSSASGPVFIAEYSDFGKGIHHDVHGPWNYIGEAEHYKYFNNDDALLRSETGCPGITRMEVLEKYKSEYSLWPPNASNPLWRHRGVWWVQLEQLTTLFGAWASDGSEMDLYAEASRYLQAESLRYSVEATVRRQPKSSGFIVWMGNEPFPNVANTSLLEYDGVPKPAYYAVKDAFDIVNVSLKYDKITHKKGEVFTAQIYICDDAISGQTGSINASIRDINNESVIEYRWNICTNNAVNFIGELMWTVDKLDSDVFFIDIELKIDNGKSKLKKYYFTIDAINPFEPLRKILVNLNDNSAPSYNI